MEFIDKHLHDILVFIGGLITGSGLTIAIRKIKNSNNKSSPITTQKGNFVGGDMAGRDISK